jgi:hypothetical protein
MAGAAEERVVRFVRTCPNVAWSGPILSSSTFAVGGPSADNQAVNFLVSNPSGESWTASPLFETLDLQYRFVDSANQASAWVVAKGVGLDAGKAAASGSWTPSKLTPDGLYELRAISKCSGKEALLDEHKQSSTATIIRGVVDRNAPEIMFATSSSGTNLVGSGDGITVTFNEDVVCTKFDVVTESSVNAKFTIKLGNDGEGGVSFADNNVIFACNGAQVRLSLSPSGVNAFNQLVKPPSPLSLTARVEIDGIMDAAGNKGAKSSASVRGPTAAGAVAAEPSANAPAFTATAAAVSTTAASYTADPMLGNLMQAVVDAETALSNAKAQNSDDSDTIDRLTAELLAAQAAAKAFATVAPPITEHQSDSGANDGQVVAASTSISEDTIMSTARLSSVVASIIIVCIVIGALIYQHRLVMLKLEELRIERNGGTAGVGSNSDATGDMVRTAVASMAMNPAFSEPDTTTDSYLSVAGKRAISETSFGFESPGDEYKTDTDGGALVNPTYDAVGSKRRFSTGSLPEDEEEDIEL